MQEVNQSQTRFALKVSNNFATYYYNHVKDMTAYMRGHHVNFYFNLDGSPVDDVTGAKDASYDDVETYANAINFNGILVNHCK